MQSPLTRRYTIPVRGTNYPLLAFSSYWFVMLSACDPQYTVGGYGSVLTALSTGCTASMNLDDDAEQVGGHSEHHD